MAAVKAKPAVSKTPVKAPAKAPAKAPPKARAIPAQGGRKLKSVATEPEQLSFDLESALKDMPENFIQCRDYMHSWRPYSATFDGVARIYESSLRCNRCSTLKVRRVNRFGSILSVHYDYPDGYTMAGSGRLDGSARDKIRLRSVLKQINVDTSEDQHA